MTRNNIIKYWELSIGMCQSSSAMDECDVSDAQCAQRSTFSAKIYISHNNVFIFVNCIVSKVKLTQESFKTVFEVP